MGTLAASRRAVHAVGTPHHGEPPSSSVWLRGIAVVTLVATASLVLLGSTVRVTESGMGCVSWPLCNGALGPPDGFHALLEQSHRYLAAVVTVGVAALVVAAWRTKDRRVLAWAAAAGVIVAVQVVLGAVTVLTDNAPATVAAHLVTGLLLLAAVSLVTAASFHLGERRAIAPEGGRRGALAWGALGATLALLVSGSLVVDGGASAACASWPWCQPATGSGWQLAALQLVHRGLAGATAVLLAALSARLLRREGRRTPAGWLALALLALLAAQVTVGAFDAVLLAPPAAQDVHVGLAGAIWTVVVVLVLEVAPTRSLAGKAAGAAP